jgi:murein L,D-transpeptidase YcbB/YkuD
VSRPIAAVVALVLGMASAPFAWAETSAEIQRRLDDEVLKVGKRAVELAPLREFYKARGWKLAWSGSGEAAGDRLIAEIQGLAVAEGLPAEPYSIPATHSDMERDFLISDAALRLGEDLASGRVQPARDLGGLELSRSGLDGTALLKKLAAAKDGDDPLARLAPQHDTYERLKGALAKYRQLAAAGGWGSVPDGPSIKPGMEDQRLPAVRHRLIVTGDLPADQDQGTVLDEGLQAGLKHFQERHGLEPDGAVGKQTLAALNVPVEARIQQMQLNLERWRWLPRNLAGTRVMVNVAGARLELYEQNKRAMEMKVVVGDAKHQTPMMASTMSSLVLNPDWKVPASIANKEVLPKLRKDPGYLIAQKLRIAGIEKDKPESQGVGVDWKSVKDGKFPYWLRQDPGPDNALGQVKFNLHNTEDIYLHDTPNKKAFGRANRALSHGCVRVERPVDLAKALLDETWAPKVPDLISEANTRTLKLERTVTVYLLYFTAWADPDGQVQFRPDLYGHDQRLRAELKHPRDAAPKVAEGAAKKTL